MTLATVALAALHVLVAATWFGAMAYSFAVLHPRAARFFGSDTARFEELMTVLADGARWKVLSMCAVLALSGGGLVMTALADAEGGVPGAWVAAVIGKVVVFVAAVAVFSYTSWRLWPARVFALPDEIPAHQRRFRLVAFGLLVLVGTAIVLGVAAGYLRAG